MGITYQIPHTAHYFTKTNIFVATFNNPTVGVYDFGIAGNTGQLITELQKNKIYLIDRVSIGGTISEANYLDSIATLPEFRLKKSQTNENVYFLPYSVGNYLDDSQITSWVLSEKGDDNLIIDFTGILNQIPATIGVATIKVHITFSIFIISSTVFYAKFRDVLSGQTGDQISGSVDANQLVKSLLQLVKRGK